MIIEYSVKRTCEQAIDIVDIGNCILKCISEDYDEYYIYIKTIAGFTNILRYGAVAPDINYIESGFQVGYKRFEFKEKTILKEINQYINDPYKKIIDIVEVTEVNFWETFPDIKNTFENL